MEKRVVLFVTHKPKQCGVYEFLGTGGHGPVLLIPPIVRTARLVRLRFVPMRTTRVSVEVTCSGTLLSFTLCPTIETFIVIAGLRSEARSAGFLVAKVKVPCPEAPGARFPRDGFV
jgi:hypothetical protein